MQPPPVSIRQHSFKARGIFEDNEAIPWCDSGRYLPSRPVFTLDPLFHAGAYYVQEASSMFLDHIIRHLYPERNGMRVLDLCAAPGGKSTLIASLLGEDSLLLSNEVIRTRASILEENICRWGYMNTWVCSNDPKDIGKLSGYFDLIVVDAPCSGSGLFRQDPRALDEWSEANVAQCSQRQQRILADVRPALKEDGILIYSTCSYSPQEDENILDWMQQEYEVETLNIPVEQEWGITEIITQSAATGYRFFPDKIKGEGFFVAAMRKRSEQKNILSAKHKLRHEEKVYIQAAHLLKKKEWFCVSAGAGYSAIHPNHEADLNILEKYVYLRRVGLPLGDPANKEWLPSHDIALSVDVAESIATVKASKEQALKFLKKEDAAFPLTERGWYIVTYNGLGLGWIKSLGNRFNNYLPKHWRIRMDINEME